VVWLVLNVSGIVVVTCLTVLIQLIGFVFFFLERDLVQTSHWLRQLLLANGRRFVHER